MSPIQHLVLGDGIDVGAGGTHQFAGRASTWVSLPVHDHTGHHVAHLQLSEDAARTLRAALSSALRDVAVVNGADDVEDDGPCCERRYAQSCAACGWGGTVAEVAAAVA